jgi:hypothetical protein
LKDKQKDNLRAQATVTDSRALQAARFKLRDELRQDQSSASIGSRCCQIRIASSFRSLCRLSRKVQ